MGSFFRYQTLGINAENTRAAGQVIAELTRERQNAGAGLIKLRGNHLRKVFASPARKKTRNAQRSPGFLWARPHTPGWATEYDAREELARKSAWINRQDHLILLKVRRTGKLLQVYFYHRKKIVRLLFFVDDLLRSFKPPCREKEAERKNILQRASENPIIRPFASNRWESDAVFNAGALYIENKVHLIYRAIGESGLSVFGYASSEDGTNINERASEPSFISDKILVNEQKNLPRYPYSSGGSWWGSEDPRLTRVDDTIYMTYTAFDGYHPPCVALTSIEVRDFLDREWKWKTPRVISEPGMTNKNWVVFPEKINGKFAILHSITPEIAIDYRDSLDFDDGGFITSRYYSKGREEYWDNWIRGVGPPPIKTNDGWLVLYHAMDKNDPGRYKIGAMLLDGKNPEHVLYRSDSPLLEPDHWYENNGHKSGVVYTCGAILLREKLFVYYGGSDCFLCAAMIDLDTLLSQLKCTAIPKLHNMN